MATVLSLIKPSLSVCSLPRGGLILKFLSGQNSRYLLHGTSFRSSQRGDKMGSRLALCLDTWGGRVRLGRRPSRLERRSPWERPSRRPSLPCASQGAALCPEPVRGPQFCYMHKFVLSSPRTPAPKRHVSTSKDEITTVQSLPCRPRSAGDALHLTRVRHVLPVVSVT